MNRPLPERLAARLARSLPGPMIGSRYESRPREGWRYDRPPPGARPAAVLILLYPADSPPDKAAWGPWRLPLTLRPPDMAVHAGQVSLPGGAVEQGESTWEAAVREFHEELGPSTAPIEPLGQLSPLYIGASNFLITSWVAATARRPALIPNPAEVAEVFEVPVAHLLDPAQFGTHRRTGSRRVITAPHFVWGKHRIWGATCMILGELVALLEEMRGDE